MAMIGAVADDFTGTASAGVLVAKGRAKTGLFFDPDALNQFDEAERLDAIYVSSNSRHLLPNEAALAVKEATSALKKMDVKYFSKKIDTTLRGGIGYEVDAMLEELEEDTVAVMVTAMPQSNRICVGGYSIIDGVILTETSVAHDVKTPVKECYVPALMAGQTKHKIAHINLRDVLAGEQVMRDRFVEARESGSRIIVVDAMTLDNVDVIAKTCVKLGWSILAVDPGAFTMKLAFHRGLIGEEQSTKSAQKTTDKSKCALLIVGSANPSTMVQMERLYADSGENVKVSVSPHALIEGGKAADDEVAKVSQIIKELIQQEHIPKAIIVETALHGSIVNLAEEDEKHAYEPGTSSEFINQGLARITENVLESVRVKIAGLLLTGGDTMECVCRTIGTACIQAIDNIVAQVDVGRIIGKYDGLPLIVKGGFCGYDDIGIDIVERLFEEAEKKEKK